MGERIGTLRKAMGMSQEQLAELLHVTRQTISKWEANKSVPDIDYLIKLGEIFRVSLDYLIAGKESDVPVSENKELDKKKRFSYWGEIILVILGVSILLLMPLFASLYQGYVFEFINSSYADYKLYLEEWPLLGGVYLGRILVILGVGLAIKKRFGTQIMKNIKGLVEEEKR